jgi:hypothetical protein
MIKKFGSKDGSCVTGKSWEVSGKMREETDEEEMEEDEDDETEEDEDHTHRDSI